MNTLSRSDLFGALRERIAAGASKLARPIPNAHARITRCWPTECWPPPKVFCDDTPMPVLDRRRRRTRMARFWFYAADDRPWQGLAAPIVVYIFAEGPSGRHVHEHLDGVQRRAAGGRARGMTNWPSQGGPAVPSPWRTVWLTPAVSSLRFIGSPSRLWLPRHCGGLRRCIGSRNESVV